MTSKMGVALQRLQMGLKLRTGSLQERLNHLEEYVQLIERVHVEDPNTAKQWADEALKHLDKGAGGLLSEFSASNEMWVDGQIAAKQPGQEIPGKLLEITERLKQLRS